MKKTDSIRRPRARALLAGAVLTALFGVIGNATAADYALIMGIGNYKEPRANLPGIDKDVATAKRIALAIGVPASNITELVDSAVSTEGIKTAVDKLTASINLGDRVFLYYSGHGSQVTKQSGAGKCSEGMVAYDMKLFKDIDLEGALDKLSAKAGQLIMMNDSCFSGGQATKSMDDAVAKSWEIKALSDNDPNYSCGNAVNMKSVARNLISAAEKKGNNMVYIAAAADNEVAFATSNGSTATVAWEQCLHNPAADRDRSGMLTAAELAQCAQERLTSRTRKQTITVIGNHELPVMFAAAPSATSATPAASAATLENLRQAASSAIQVELTPAKPTLRIEKEELNFQVRSSKAGYLYILHVGTDGKTFDLLFPNKYDENNFIQSTAVSLPRPSWRIRAGGPAGTSYLLAIVSETPRNFGNGMRDLVGPFRTTPVSSQSQRSLYVSATGAGSDGRAGPYGASAVVPIQEIN